MNFNGRCDEISPQFKITIVQHLFPRQIKTPWLTTFHMSFSPPPSPPLLPKPTLLYIDLTKNCTTSIFLKSRKFKFCIVFVKLLN